MAGNIYLSEKEIDTLLLSLSIFEDDTSEETFKEDKPIVEKLKSKLYKL